MYTTICVLGENEKKKQRTKSLILFLPNTRSNFAICTVRFATRLFQMLLSGLRLITRKAIVRFFYVADALLQNMIKIVCLILHTMLNLHASVVKNRVFFRSLYLRNDRPLLLAFLTQVTRYQYCSNCLKNLSTRKVSPT